MHSEPLGRIGEELSIRQVTTTTDSAATGFVETYRVAFADAPYFETYEPEWVLKHVWEPHLPHCILVAEVERAPWGVAGLACCHALLADTEPEVRDYLVAQRLPFDPEHTVFMSELAVRREFRRQGLGAKLIQARLRWAEDTGFRFFALRTAATGSNSRRLYERIGAHTAPFVQDVSAAAVASSSTQRIFLWGETSWHRRV